MSDANRERYCSPISDCTDLAAQQIALMTGDESTPVRLRAIHCDKEKGLPAHEFEGPIRKMADRSRSLNLEGYNIYVVAQQTRSLPMNNYFTTNDDIIKIRCLYADGDNCAMPNKWHVEPTFVLCHRKTGRWWAFWAVSYAVIDHLEGLIKKVAARYKSDPSISNLARIVRLAGFDRWKDGENFGPYSLNVLSGETSEEWEHQGLPAISTKSRRDRNRSFTEHDDQIGLQSLQQLLLLIPPLERETWLKVMFAIRDGVVIDENGEPMCDAAKLLLFDDWSSGHLYSHLTGISPK